MIRLLPQGCDRLDMQLTCKIHINKYTHTNIYIQYIYEVSLPKSCICMYVCVYIYIYICVCIYIYRVSQEERTKLREGVPYVKLYRYNPKHLCPKLNGFQDNGKWSLKLWQLLHTYWLPNSYWNWQEYVVSIMLISVLNIKVTCEWHKAINLNCKVPRIHIKDIHRVRSTIHHNGMLSGDVTRPADRLPASLTYAEICISSESQQN